MRKTSITLTAKQKESSLTRYVLRVKEDARLHDDIVDYVTKHDISMEKLVDSKRSIRQYLRIKRET